MAQRITKKINKDFFKILTPQMSYILGFVVADGCIFQRGENSYIFNITSKDKDILFNIRRAMGSNHPIGIKYNSQRMPYSYIQICDRDICRDLIALGIHPRKTYNLEPIEVPEKYFADFVRGFFDGDGSVYIYNVNKVPQIKSSFICTSLDFITDFNKHLCEGLGIPEKSIHRTIGIKAGFMTQYSNCFYIDDSEKLAKFMYENNPSLYLERKREIFRKWGALKRRHFIKKNYPSKIGWRLSEGFKAA